MIASNIIGNVSLTPQGMVCLVVVAVLATCVIIMLMLHVPENVDQTSSVLARMACERLETKIWRHWKMLLLMALLRWCGLFDGYTILDELMWTCYATYIDD